MGATQKTEHVSLQTVDETREFPNGRAEIVNVGSGEVDRFVFEPGWRWSNDVKPIADTDSCEAPHACAIGFRSCEVRPLPGERPAVKG